MNRLVFVDRTGGALASLCASVAQSRGRTARAETTTPIVDRPEVSAALAEIGATVVAAAIQPERAPNDLVIELGKGGQAPDVGLYEGPPTTAFGDTTLERIALARISRDRVERWLEALPP